MSAELDRWLSPEIRGELEERYYAQVNRRARFQALVGDPLFLDALRTGQTHVGFFSDHGVVHVRDVARQVVAVLERVHGLLIPRRPAWRLASMQGYGVLLAYFHDIGMVDFSPFGRAMHPEFAAHAVFSPEMDELVETIWRENGGNMAWRLTQLSQAAALTQPPQLVLRELLALALGHSKSKLPIATLNDPVALRDKLVAVCTTDLTTLYRNEVAERARAKLGAAREAGNQSEEARWQRALAEAETLAADPAGPILSGRPLPDDAFAWLLSNHPATRELVDDVLDVVRVLRCADSLRLRGLVLKTSGGYEMFISRVTGRAIYSFQSNDGRLYLLETSDPMGAGEAIIAGSELDSEGNLRIAFHRGAFETPAATEYAVAATVGVVGDIVRDTLESYQRPPGAAIGLKPADETLVLLEEADDSADFVAHVRQRLIAGNPALRGRVRLVPSLREASERERALYLAATPFTTDPAARREVLDRLRQTGQQCDLIIPDHAFQDVRVVALRHGEVIIEAGATATFVYIPLGEGLKILPLGGYDAIPARAWTPLGVTGVIRGAPRNATVVAEKPLSLLIIPKGVYLREWYNVHTPETFLSFVQAASTSPIEGDG